MKNVDDYDLHLQTVISRNLSCIPPFWTYGISGTSLVNCNSLKNLRAVREAILKLNTGMLADYHPPCLDRFNSIVWNWYEYEYDSMDWNTDYTHVRISYVDKFYIEITQVEDFGFQDFISNLGGFIGIFLGYSMMQIPELLCKSPI